MKRVLFLFSLACLTTLFVACSEENDTVEEFPNWRKTTTNISMRSTKERQRKPLEIRGRPFGNGHCPPTTMHKAPTTSSCASSRRAREPFRRSTPTASPSSTRVGCCLRRVIRRASSSTNRLSMISIPKRLQHAVSASRATSLTALPLPFSRCTAATAGKSIFPPIWATEPPAIRRQAFPVIPSSFLI